MLKLLLIVIMSLVPIHANAVNNKQLAFSTLKQFFDINQEKRVLEGHFVKTNPDYGSSCKIHQARHATS